MRLGIVGAVALSLRLCDDHVGAIDPGDQPKPGYAYLYGQLLIRADEQEGSFVGHQQILLRVWCRNSQEYTIAFSTKRDVQVLKVHPSAVRFVGGVFTNQNGIVRRRQNIEPGPRWSLHDFRGRAEPITSVTTSREASSS